jgi:hypothetical protein
MVMLITELWDCLLILSKHYLDIFFVNERLVVVAVPWEEKKKVFR